MIFFSLLTGHLPFVTQSTTNSLELVHSIITKPVPSVSSIRSNAPVTLSNIVAKCTSKLPIDRYQSVYGLLGDLFRVYQQLVDYSLVKLDRPIDVPSAVHTIMVHFYTGRISSSSRSSTPESRDSGISDRTATKLCGPLSPFALPSPLLASQALMQQLDDDDRAVGRLNLSQLRCRTVDLRHRNSLSSNSSSSPTQFTRSVTLVTLPTDEELGLKPDLSSLADSFPSFPLGQEDAPSRLFISLNLYGRKEVQQEMFAALTDVVLMVAARCSLFMERADQANLLLFVLC